MPFKNFDLVYHNKQTVGQENWIDLEYRVIYGQGLDKGQKKTSFRLIAWASLGIGLG